MTSRKSQSGVTLMELMVVVTIAAIMASLAAPAFTGFINSTKQSSAVSQLMSDLNRARGEAIKRNSRVLLCVRNTAGTDCGTATNWQNGWLVCYDLNVNGQCDTPPVDGSNPNPIAKHGALDANLTLLTNANLVQFNPNGTQGTAGAATLTINGSWTGATASTISVAVTGTITKQ